MEKYIKYKRMSIDILDETEMQKHFDDLIQNGWEIIYYDEKIKNINTLTITVVVGKKQNNIL